MMKKSVALMLALNMLFSPAAGLAGIQNPALRNIPALAPPPVNSLPGGATIVRGVDSITTDSLKNQMVINQNQQYATINWQSFNIGANATVYFSQKNAQGVAQPTWVALNRIYGRDPSQIFGNLKADGKVYLINQNGFLFGANSRVDVHTLVASTFNISNSDFYQGLLKFTGESYQDYDPNSTTLAGADSSKWVVNQGNITAGAGGSVYLLGPNVLNTGSIDAPAGIIGLVAVNPRSSYNITPTADADFPYKINYNCGGSVCIDYDVQIADNNDHTKALTSVQANITLVQGMTGGGADNSGSLTADAGLVGMYGRTVNQDGLVRAITAVKTGGIIELLATDKVSLGANSLTTSPISDTADTADASFTYQPGRITVGGFNTYNYDTNKGTWATGTSQAKEISLQGAIVAPSGTVNLQASDKITLEAGSRIDVSGLWVDEAASASLITAQLNSIQLKDDYGQKDGILKGETITFDSRFGSSIGDVSGYFNAVQLTAREKSTKGGTISLGSYNKGLDTTKQIIVKPGSEIDFAGGGYRYAAGSVTTTMLVSGNRIYDISNAPEWATYDKIINVSHMGGGYTRGSDAGQATLLATQVVLAGKVDGSATRGLYQTLLANPTNFTGKQSADGRTEPAGGTLQIGTGDTVAAGTSLGYKDFVVKEVEIAGTTGFANFDPNSQKSLLFADVLNGAGLSNLSIYANTRITVDADARITLPSFNRAGTTGSSVTMQARTIDFRGEIDAPSGTVNLVGADNITSKAMLGDTPNGSYVELTDEHILLDSGSKINVAGDRIDNSQAGNGSAGVFGHTAGGSINLTDNTLQGAGVIVKSGALVDASGGYSVDGKGKISGGDAGAVSITGPNLVLDGDIQGLSLVGNKGGQITLESNKVTVSDGNPADGQLDGLVLNSNTLAGSGFTRIELRSRGDLLVGEGTTLAPSMAKLRAPVRGSATGGQSIMVSRDLVGNSSITLRAGVTPPDGLGGTKTAADNSAKVDILDGAAIETAPGGTISLVGPNITIAGKLDAPAGTINASLAIDVNSATPSSSELIIDSTARLYAGGYNMPVPGLIAGVPAMYLPMAAGSINLSAVPVADQTAFGDLVINKDAVLDVSGSAAVPYTYLQGNGRVNTVMAASNPGNISLTYSKSLTQNGTLLAKGHAAGLQGGGLTINGANPDNIMTVSAAELDQYWQNGFDALKLVSQKEIEFSWDAKYGNIEFGRSLYLDAPIIAGAGTDAVSLSAPSVTLTNSYYPANPYVNSDKAASPSAGNATMSLTGDSFLDITGGVVLSGFKSVNLAAGQDIRLTDAYYSGAKAGKTNVAQGLLENAGDLTLTASRIYPTSQSSFIIQSDAGTITVKPGDNPGGPIYSAFGTLTLNANGANGGIDQQGYLAAPFGTINLNSASGRILLGNGSVTTTAGSAIVNIGSLDDQYVWTRTHNGATLAIDGQPQQAVNINGKQALVAKDAVMDISGGGAIFASLFTADSQGSVNPLTKSGVYVILPDNSVTIPGNAVYLAGNAALGLKAGVYSLLPADQYGFVPGALVVSGTTTPVAATDNLTTQQGYAVVPGYATYAGSNVSAPYFTGYSVRRASDVLKEGNFDIHRQFVATDAGAVSINGHTTILNGEIRANALPGYKGGSISLSAGNITVLGDNSSAVRDYGFTEALDPGLEGTMEVSAASLSGHGLEQLKLGSLTDTDKLTVKTGAILSIPEITLAANSSITLESGSQVNATTAATLATNGSLTVQDNALVHAASAVNLTATSMDYQGKLEVDNGALNVTGNKNVYIVNTASTDTTNLYLTKSFTDNFNNIDTVKIASASDIGFKYDAVLAAKNSLTLDAARITADSNVTAVNLTAVNINLVNSGKTPPNQTITANRGNASITFDARAITVNVGNNDDTSKKWDIALDGFNIVNFGNYENNGVKPVYNLGDLTMTGVGTLTVPADVNITAARITTGVYADASTTYKTARVTLDATGVVNIAQGSGASGTSSVPGGSLTIRGGSISDSGTIDIASGQVTLTAAEAGGIVLNSGARILATGTKTQGEDKNADPVYTPGGMVTLNAESGPLTLAEGSLIDVSAADKGDAGTISLSVPKGVFTLAGDLKGTKGSGASDRGGSFVLDAARVDGKDGGTDLSTLNAKLATKLATSTTAATGGFDQEIGVRARNGDLTVAAADKIKAANISLAADAGNLTLNGALDASGVSIGGTVELSAGNTLSLADGSSIDVHGSEKGGMVWLNAGGVDANNNPLGLLDFASGAIINAAGATADTGGTVHFRAMRTATNDDILMSYNGTVNGASRIEAEAVKVYNLSSIGSADIAAGGAMFTEAGYFADNFKGTNITALTGNPAFHLMTGIEVRSKGDLTLANDWDLSSWRFGNNEPGVLTLRAAGNLNINANLVDASSGAGQPSWGINLAAGADLSAANPMAVTGTTGTLTISRQVFGTNSDIAVYTENAPLRFASAGDTVINGAGTISDLADRYLPYLVSLGTFSGTVIGKVGGNFVLNGGVVQTGTGAIDLGVAGDIRFIRDKSDTGYGAIRTTGHAPADFEDTGDYTTFYGGGDIRIAAGGSVTVAPGAFSDAAFNTWDSNYSYSGNYFFWSANYDNHNISNGTGYFTQGIATMAGGNIELRAGRDFSGQAGAFGKGDLKITAGGDAWGRFLVGHGNGDLNVMGNIGAPQVWSTNKTTGINTITNLYQQPVIELGGVADTSGNQVFRATAQGNVFLGTALNPTLAYYTQSANNGWDPTYALHTDLALTALTGGVSIYGKSYFYPNAANIFPQSLEIAAARDINLYRDITLAPAPDGALRMFAGGSITSKIPADDTTPAITHAWPAIRMSDMAMDVFYAPSGSSPDYTSIAAHGPSPDNGDVTLHYFDADPVVISAEGNISGLKMILAKKADISAGGDIANAYFVTQNNRPDDVTTISAGGDITLTISPDKLLTSGVLHGGPGYLFITAGGSIDLGTSNGVQEVGGLYNPYLGTQGSAVAVIAGAGPKATPAGTADFFNLKYAGDYADLLKQAAEVDGEQLVAVAEKLIGETPDFIDQLGKGKVGLQQAGIAYTTLKGLAGNSLLNADDRRKLGEYWQKIIAQARIGVIDPFFLGSSTSGGNISMVSSQISTNSGKDDIYIIAKGEINVGRTALNTGKSASTGIYTATGGDISIYSGASLNVNESRVMTFFGGDVTGWSDEGSINAGRGSRTAVNAEPPKQAYDPILKQYYVKFTPPAVGSGIRAITYDPNTTPGGTLKTPDPGNIYLFAPQGVIDAGEAGIAGGRVVLGATEVLNAKNISFTGGSVGVPSSSEGSVNLGALAGAGSVADTGKLVGQSSAFGGARDKLTQQANLVDDFLSKLLDVRVINFDTDEGNTDNDKQDEVKRKKI